MLIFEQHEGALDFKESSFKTSEQQGSILDTTETSTKFDPQKCFSILKEKEANTTANAMSVEVNFFKIECFML